MAWMELHEQTYDHPKVRRLAHLIAEPEVTVKGIIMNLWLFSLKFAQDGDLTKHEQDLPHYLQTPPGRDYDIVKAMVETGWLDRVEGKLRVHDWDKMGVRLLFNQRERVAKHRERKSLEEKKETLHKHYGNVLQTVLTVQTVLTSTHIGKFQSKEFELVFLDYCEHRRQLGKPLTDLAIDRMMKKLSKMQDDPIEVLNQSIENGWQGVFEIKNGSRGKYRFDPKKYPSTGRS